MCPVPGSWRHDRAWAPCWQERARKGTGLGCGVRSSSHRGSCAGYKLAIGRAGALEPVDACGEICVPGFWRDVKIILQHRGAELVVVRVGALEINEPLRCLDEAGSVSGGPQMRQRLA